MTNINTIDTSKLVNSYLNYLKTHNPDDIWAVDLFDHELVYDNPEKAWPILLESVKLAENKTQLSLIAAGPLENIVNYHGHNFIEKIEEEAKINPRFAWTILGVWPNEKDKIVFSRFTALQKKYQNHDIDLPEK